MNEEATFPSRPCKRDDVLRAVQTLSFKHAHLNKIVSAELHEEHIKEIRNAEWFDFGHLSDRDGEISKLANDAIDFSEAGLVILPHPITIFRARIGLHVEDSREGETTRKFFESEFVQLLVQPTPKDSINMTSFMIGDWDYSRAAILAQVQYRNNQIYTQNTYDPKAAAVEYRMFLAMWLMLNARNMEHHIEEPSAKLNKARAKSGKTPLKRVTYVSTKRYIDAMRETVRREGGERASPCMHVRRAHLRHLSDDRIIPIHAMIIGAGDGPEREHYEVKP